MTCAAVALGWSIALVIVALAAALGGPRARDWPPRVAPWRILVARPCAGDEPHLEPNLVSLARAHSSSVPSCAIAIADERDGSAQAARRAAPLLIDSGFETRVIVTRPSAPNAKADQLARVVALASFDVLVVADSDVDLGDVDLDLLLAPLADARVGATWAPPVELGGETIGDRASRGVLTASLHAFPLLARIDRHGFVGKLSAVRADALTAIGGFDDLASHLGEDVELARRLREARFEVVAVPLVAIARPASRSFAASRARFARWLRVVRAQRGALLLSYPILFFATPMVLVLSAIAMTKAPLLAVISAALALSARALVAVIAARASGRTFRGIWLDAVLADAVLALATFDALLGRTVVWRGRRLTFDERGRLALEATTEAARGG